MSAVRIRLASPRDVAWLLHIEQQSGCAAATESHMREIVAQARSVPPVYVAAVACRGNERLAYILYDAFPADAGPDKPATCHVWRLVVTPTARRKGIGRRLVQHAADQHPKAALQFSVSEYELTAQLFLRTCGFSVRQVQTTTDMVDTTTPRSDTYVFVRDPA